MTPFAIWTIEARRFLRSDKTIVGSARAGLVLPPSRGAGSRRPTGMRGQRLTDVRRSRPASAFVARAATPMALLLQLAACTKRKRQCLVMVPAWWPLVRDWGSVGEPDPRCAGDRCWAIAESALAQVVSADRGAHACAATERRQSAALSYSSSEVAVLERCDHIEAGALPALGQPGIRDAAGQSPASVARLSVAFRTRWKGSHS